MVEQIAMNMERWRWLPDDLGSRYLMVNIPAFRLDVDRGGQERARHERRHRQEGQPDAGPVGSHEVRGLQPVLEYSAGHRAERDRCPRPRRIPAISSATTSKWTRKAAATGSARAKATRLGWSSSSFRTISTCTCTTRRRTRCSIASSATSATAAYASSVRWISRSTCFVTSPTGPKKRSVRR